MNIAVPKEVHPGETRVALVPEHIARLVEMGAHIAVETGIGQKLNFSDVDYAKAGASLEANRINLLEAADMVMRIRKPAMEEIALLKEESIYVSLLDPFNEQALHGNDPAHHTGPKNGCLKLTGKFSRLCSRDSRRRTPR
jgi:NAD(P) transhydrogenase subunit alpha